MDYDRAFSATLRATTFRTLLSIASGKKLKLVQYDVSNAFTQAELDDVDLFVEPPRGFEEWEIIDGKRVSKLLHLKKALYGTKQAARLWQETLRSFLVDDMAFKQSQSDPCIFRKSRGDDEIIIGVYVDDLIVAHRGDKLLAEFDKEFNSRFTVRNEGALKWFLGMAIDQQDDFSITLNHSLSITKLYEKHCPGSTVTREYPSPEIFEKLGKPQDDEERARAEKYHFPSIIGSLLYISVMSRPDICYHTSVLAKHMSDPSEDACKAAIHLLQYLYGSRDRKMAFTGMISAPKGLEVMAPDIRRNAGFVAYSDSSWGNRYPYPMFGFGIYLYGSLISFSSKQLKTVAFSSCEAEYAAASYTCKEIEFIRNICSDMGVVLQGRLVLAVDNTAAIDIAYDVGVSGRTKHFDRAIHYLRDLTQMRRVVPIFVKTDLQRADGYTKALCKAAYLQWLSSVVT